MDIWGTDFTGLQQNPDGSFSPDNSALERAGLTGVTTADDDEQLQEEAREASQEVEDLAQDFLDYNVDTDPAYATQAQNVKNMYDKMRRDMERANAARAKALQTLGIRGGAARYAGAIQLGIEGEEILKTPYIESGEIKKFVVRAL